VRMGIGSAGSIERRVGNDISESRSQEEKE